ncbi:MAG: regulatory protein GemA [Spirochaetaceae bacterium]|nr:regulatory protein GemA [Spirochaetaceae bacterium]
MALKAWIKMIHTAKTKTGISEEAYRAILAGAAGVDSSTEIKTWEQYKAVMSAFRVLGFVPSSRTRKEQTAPQEKRSPWMISARQEYYIRGLWEVASRCKDEASLRHMIKRIAGVDDVTWLDRKHASQVILALRSIAIKAGINPDKGDR